MTVLLTALFALIAAASALTIADSIVRGVAVWGGLK